ncbi:hypothetical protein NDU88_001138 [Pleurodeles waltl]|uniref:Secreted protein n=1 Tax=Pleurodeles waltl TaxID=8319 RepID=A0AAV7VA24_PLEWA|nr:hypothetical protein NDU88_001138 [Pleurodeles waltl]
MPVAITGGCGLAVWGVQAFLCCDRALAADWPFLATRNRGLVVCGYQRSSVALGLPCRLQAGPVSPARLLRCQPVVRDGPVAGSLPSQAAGLRGAGACSGWFVIIVVVNPPREQLSGGGRGLALTFRAALVNPFQRGSFIFTHIVVLLPGSDF